MNEGYIIYRCKICGKVFLLLTNDVKHSERESKYLTCPYDGRHSKLSVVGRIDKYGEIKGCMDHDSYKREGKRIKQR